MSKSKIIRAGITIGDPAGIGPAITVKALTELKGAAHFFVIGDKWLIRKVAKRLSLDCPFDIIDLKILKRTRIPYGKVSLNCGRASLGYLDKSIELIKKGFIDCLVTAPISKQAINLSGCRYPGHTEYIASSFMVRKFVMMLLNKRIRFSLLTRHIPLSCVFQRLNRIMLTDNALLTHQSLNRLFGIKNPRIVICGINPHASDNGLIGKEEARIITPALKMIKDTCGIKIEGPLPADEAVYQASNGKYDCVIGMYHDQALIPLKMSDRHSGVNITLGLPFVRTSPLHGTAFDIAVNPQTADPRSMIEAVRVAIKCTKNLKNI